VQLYELQNHDDNDYNYWQSQQSVEDDVLAKMNHGDSRSLLDASDEKQISFSDIYTYPMPLDYYDLDSDRHREQSYHLT